MNQQNQIMFGSIEEMLTAARVDARKTQTEYTPIPEKTKLSCVIDGCEWREYNGINSINLKIKVIDVKFTNRVLFKDFRVNDIDQHKAYKSTVALIKLGDVLGIDLCGSGQMPTNHMLNMIIGKNVDVVVSLYTKANGTQANGIMYFDKPSYGAMQQPQVMQPQAPSFTDPSDDIPF